MIARGFCQSEEITNKVTFGTVFSEIRRDRKLLQKQVALEANVDPSYLAALERGRRRPPPQRTLNRLIRALDATHIERQKILRYAALGRIAHAIDVNAACLVEACWISRIVGMAPIIGEEGRHAIDAVVRAIASHGTSKTMEERM